MSRTALITAIVAGLAGCGPPPKDPALEAYEQLFAALREARTDDVWALLSPASQKTLAARMQLDAQAPDAVRDRLDVRPGWQFEVDRLRRPTIDPDDRGGSRRVVVGRLAGSAWRVPVVLVEGAWRVDLLGAHPLDGG